MNVIVFLFGFVATFILCMVFLYDKYKAGRLYEFMNNDSVGDLGFLYNKWSEFFKDEHLMWESRGVPYGLKFKYYGGTWQLGGASELYWISSSFRGIAKETPVYSSHWNYWRNDFESMKYIMENHPNLREERKRLKKEDKIPIIIKKQYDGTTNFKTI